ncbi:calcium-binding protein [Mesorhizobium sp. ASY16-5R]|uniref:calcium-binding protein n=1 Tax=Mesorhizobium sp. ASY16-5R TaxID=3445772 RepID=UPI003F9EE8E4
MTIYKFERWFAPQVISNFQAGDRLDFSAFNIATFDQFDSWNIQFYKGGTEVGFLYNSVLEHLTVENYTLTEADFIFNTSRSNLSVVGTAGNDTLFGGLGNDTINGGGKVDTMAGGTGNDTYHVDNQLDDVREAVGGGFDHVAISLRGDYNFYELEPGVEVEKLTSNNLNSTKYLWLIGNEFSQTLIGTAGENELKGAGGDDILIGYSGADLLSGGDGFDIASYRGSKEAVLASLADPLANTNDAEGDTYYGLEGLTGSSFADTLVGDDWSNTLDGSGGNDILIGGLGFDTLVGGSGDDTFVFDTAPSNSGSYDKIADFSAADTIRLDSAVFTALPAGALAAFNIFNDGPKDANDRIIYNSVTGNLYYDADGSGAAFGNVKFANLIGAPDLTASAFEVV